MACEARWGSVLIRVRWPAIQRLSMAVISEDTGDAAASGGGGGAAAGAAGLGRPSGMLAGMDRGAIDTLCRAGSSRLLTSIGQRHCRHTCRLLHHVHKHDPATHLLSALGFATALLFMSASNSSKLTNPSPFASAVKAAALKAVPALDTWIL